MKTEPFISKDGFEIKQFNSGEWDVRFIGDTSPDEVHWNWFKEPDIMIPLMKGCVLNDIYGEKRRKLIAPYYPYTRQDRAFLKGQTNYVQAVTRAIKSYFYTIETLSPHSDISVGIDLSGGAFIRKTVSITNQDKVFIFPDESAFWRFNFESKGKGCIYLTKQRTDHEVKSVINKMFLLVDDPFQLKHFLIVDDICDGGRSFIEAVNAIKNHRYFMHLEIEIELLVAHGFMTQGTQILKDAGISKIHIANPDSYDYLTEKFNDPDYIKLWDK